MILDFCRGYKRHPEWVPFYIFALYMANEEVITAQHFLPKCYLNGFVNNRGKLSVLNTETLTKYGKVPNPKEYTPTQICYEDDFYTLEPGIEAFNVKGFSDKYYVEKKFHEYERHYHEIINKIKESQFLTTGEASFLVRVIFDIKIRNKYFREKIIAPQQSKIVNYASDEIKKLLLNDPEYLGKYEGLTIDEILSLSDLVKEKLLSNSDFKKNAHLSMLYRQSDGYLEGLSLAKKKFLSSKWIIMESPGQFISNDNPGFSMDENNNIINFLTKDDFLFFMPLTSSLCLTMSSAIIDQDFISTPICKNLNKSEAPEKIIETSNSFTTRHFNKLIYGSDMIQMDKISKKLRINP